MVLAPVVPRGTIAFVVSFPAMTLPPLSDPSPARSSSSAPPHRTSAVEALRPLALLTLLALPLLSACEPLASRLPWRSAKGTADSTADSTVDSTAQGGEGTSPAQASADVSGDGPRRMALPVVADTARDGDLVLRVRTTGAVVGDAVARLAADVNGTVAEVLVHPGQAVRKGQPLVRFEVYPFDLAVREAQAALAEREQAYRESFVPESTVTGRGPTPEQRQALRVRSGVASAELRLERVQWERQRAVITAPVNGIVDRIPVTIGERVSTGTLVATVVDRSALRVEARVLEHDLPLIREGSNAVVTSAALGGARLEGTVLAILPLVDSTTRAGRVLVRVKTNTTSTPANTSANASANAPIASNALRPGMYADIELESTRLPNRRLVPARAIIERDGRPLVFVVRDGRAQWTYVTPGRSNGIDTELLPDPDTGVIPVEAGDEVIVDGHLTLTHDAPVRPTRTARE